MDPSAVEHAHRLAPRRRARLEAADALVAAGRRLVHEDVDALHVRHRRHLNPAAPHAALRHLGDEWDVLADARLLQQRILHLGDAQTVAIVARRVDVGIVLAAFLFFTTCLKGYENA